MLTCGAKRVRMSTLTLAEEPKCTVESGPDTECLLSQIDINGMYESSALSKTKQKTKLRKKSVWKKE